MEEISEGGNKRDVVWRGIEGECRDCLVEFEELLWHAREEILWRIMCFVLSEENMKERNRKKNGMKWMEKRGNGKYEDIIIITMFIQQKNQNEYK